MPPTEAASTLNARGRKLPKDSHGNVVAKDTGRKESDKIQKKKKFVSQLDQFFCKVESDPET